MTEMTIKNTFKDYIEIIDEILSLKNFVCIIV